MNNMFSSLAIAATVVTLTLASADVIASSAKAKGHDKHKGNGHQHDHPGYKGNGHQKHHNHDDDSCEAPDSGSGKGKGHDKHKGNGHQHDHPGYKGNGHQKHHNHDDDSCGGGGGDTGGEPVILPQGCFATAAFSANSFSAVYGSTRFGYVLNAAAAFAQFNTDAVDAAGVIRGTFGVLAISSPGILQVNLSSATGYNIREINVYAGTLGSYSPGTAAQTRWTGASFVQLLDIPHPGGEILELVVSAVICEVNTNFIPPN
jgi:hypothetical protein